MAHEKIRSIASGIVWIFLISSVLFWLPVLGLFIAGVVGGKKAGGVISALVAFFLSCILFGVILFTLASSLTDIPFLGAIAGTGALLFSLVHVRPLLVGSLIGGIIACKCLGRLFDYITGRGY